MILTAVDRRRLVGAAASPVANLAAIGRCPLIQRQTVLIALIQ